ncbi:MAG: hypothetical protein Q8M09_10485 [Pseudomonadota bacterium]|nr:hypothetical protein [Pseudomonadota bacterium]MDP1904654.1 hypothetical protein [Pseudomonadota bacterium]MDP2352984.1 hypothetical protein [Pseudomonadota bacterium]
MPKLEETVIPAQAGIQFVGLTARKINQMHNLDSRLRGNDGVFFSRFETFTASVSCAT